MLVGGHRNFRIGIDTVRRTYKMKSLKVLTLALLVMAFTLIGSWAYAQNPSSGENKWEFTITPYLWMPQIEGDITVKEITTHVDVPFRDILQDLDFGGEVHIEAWKGGRWGIFLDATYLKLSMDNTGTSRILGPVDVNVDIGEWLVEFGGVYRLGRWSLGKEKGRTLSLDALGGGRYWDLSVDLDATVPLAGLERDVSRSKNWIDPFFGARVLVDLTEKLSLAVRGDIGGFGVGSSSQFTWNTSAIFGYHFSPMISAWLGYKALGVDYESGSLHRKFKFDVIMYGPIVGLGIQF
jgi:hypothetical protein